MSTAMMPPLTKHPLIPEPDEPQPAPDLPPGFEFVNDQLVEKAMGAVSTWVAGEVFDQLRTHCRRTNSGIAFVAELGFRCFPKKPTQVRKPDVVVVRCDPRTYVLPSGWVEEVPALVVEVVSPNETATELMENVNDFLAAGTPLVWVIIPESRQATIYRADRTIALLTDPAELSGENVLPGLAIPLAAVLPPVAAEPQPAPPG
jgi:Uma2 family endonuclease